MLPILLPIIFLAWILYQAYVAIYNLYWHPLAGFPGPKSWIAFPFLRQISGMRGNLEHEIRNFHEKYGEVVRYSDCELTFTTAEAWKDIYGHGRERIMPKLDTREVGSHPDILQSDSADHARFRKAISHAFSEKGLRIQEPIIRQYIDQLMDGLKMEAAANRPVDLTMWYNLTTFDVISDLSFGKTFGSLVNKVYTKYIEAVFDFMQAGPFVRTQKRFPTVWTLFLAPFYNRYVKATRTRLRDISRETALERAYDDEMVGRGDFMDAMMRHRGAKDGLTDADIAANANVLMIAGSETTATLLSGITYHLLKTPHVMQKVTEEVRSAFNSEEEIDFMSATQKLPYMLACLDETLRIYPPVPGTFSRVAKETCDVSGYTIPAGTMLGVHQISANWSERNYYHAKEFIPERWLPEATTNPASPYYNDNRGVAQPFSFGPRNCIGRNLAYNEMRLIMAKLLFNFDLEMCPESENWEDQKIMVLWVKSALMCRLKLREDSKETMVDEKA